MVLSYLGIHGINRIVKLIANFLTFPPKLKDNADILDVGVGSGIFTAKIIEEVSSRMPNASLHYIYVMHLKGMSLQREPQFRPRLSLLSFKG